MSDLQTKIEKILSKRGQMGEEILSQFKRITALIDNIESIKQQIVKGQIKSCERFVADLDQVREKLEVASSNFNFLKQRIKRTDAVYIGLAGESRAGKSTFIQALTGLPDALIPSADDDNRKPTTAVHSEIHNSAEKEARIYFLSKLEFEQKIKEMLAQFGLEDYSELDKFEHLNLSNIEKKNQTWEKLQNIQEAIPSFKEYLLNPTEPVILKENQFAEGKYYFTYMYEDAKHRFFPAVKEAKIYAPFSGVANDVHVVLWDLPGFNEAAKVTSSTMDKLKTVDFVLYVENTSSSQAHFQEAFYDYYRKLQDNILLKDTFEYYMTFLLNRYEHESGVNEACAQMSADLNRTTPHDVLACALKDVAKNLNKEDVKDIFGKLADTLGDTLSKMDGELYDLFKKTVTSDGLAEKLEDIKNVIVLQSSNNRQPGIDWKDADTLRKTMASKYKALQKEIYDNISKSQTEFKEIVKEKKRVIKESVENSLFYPDMESWMSDAISETEANGADGFRQAECHRIWVEIVSGYEGLNEYFETKLNDFKMRVLNIFKTATKNFLPNDDNASSTDTQNEINVLLQKLEKFGLMENGDQTRKNDIYKAFEFLINLRQDFRQSIYPYFFKEEVDEYLNPNAAGNEGKLRIDKNGLAMFRQGNGSVESTKQQLINFSIAANSKVYETILKYNDFEYYLLSSLNTFDEWLISSRKDITDFIDFVSTFRSDLFPEKYGDESESKKLAVLNTSVEKALTIVKQFN